MEFKSYKLSYYLNAQHSFDCLAESIHSHTFFISLYLENLKENEINFPEIDHLMNSYFGQFKGQYLNEIAPFNQLLPTIENLGSVFFEQLKTRMSEQGYDLIKLDISENPLRIYSISDRLYLGRMEKGRHRLR